MATPMVVCICAFEPREEQMVWVEAPGTSQEMPELSLYNLGFTGPKTLEEQGCCTLYPLTEIKGDKATSPK